MATFILTPERIAKLLKFCLSTSKQKTLQFTLGEYSYELYTQASNAAEFNNSCVDKFKIGRKCRIRLRSTSTNSRASVAVEFYK